MEHPVLDPLQMDPADARGELPHLDQPELANEEAPIQLMPKQDQFIFSTRQFSGYGGGVGNGKSMSAIIKVYNYCMEQPGAYVLVGRRDYPKLRDSTIVDWMQMMRGFGKFSSSDKSFQFPNGSKVIFRHLEDLDALTNLNLSGFWIEQAEEVGESVFTYLVGRCRMRKGLTGLPITFRPKIITFNPNGHDWIWRRFYADPANGKYRLDPDGKRLDNDDDYELVMATTLENRANLPEDYLKSILSEGAEWKKRFVEGSFDTRSGAIFEEFNRQIHVIPFQKYLGGGQLRIPLAFERLRAIDHGQNNPTACLWGAVDFQGNLIIYQEYYRPSDTVSNHVRYILDKSRIQGEHTLVDDNPYYSYTVIDPSTAGKTREKDGHLFSVADEYLDAGLPTIKAQNDVIAGINRVREYLKVDPFKPHLFLQVKDLDERHPLWKYNLGRAPEEMALGAPKLYIYEGCEALITELPEYHWEPLRASQLDTVNNKERPYKHNDHACFVAGTLIKTPAGDRPIETIQVGDEVITPFGTARVLASESTGTHPVYDYGAFTVTANHPILNNKGIHQLDTLGYDSLIWQHQHNPKPFTLMEYLIAATLTPQNEVSDFIFAALVMRGLEAKQATFTATSGSTTTDPSLLATLSTIKTATMTTRLNLLSSLLKNNTLSSMLGVTGPVAKTFLLELDHLLKSGTALPKVEHGTANMVSLLGEAGCPNLLTALSAVEATLRSSLVAANSVLELAKPTPCGAAEVFNLTTSDGMYIAGNILVSNCDALRYMIMSRPIAPTEAQQIDPKIWNDPITLARYAQSIGRTADDLINERYQHQRRGGEIRHSNTGISHSGSISHQRGL